MFISFSRTIARFGKFRISIGKRITSKNAWWMWLIVCFVAVCQLMWYSCVISFWLLYAMGYGIWWCCRKIVQGIVRVNRGAQHINIANQHAPSTKITKEAATYPVGSIHNAKYCSNCGAALKAGNAFCIMCGVPIE